MGHDLQVQLAIDAMNKAIGRRRPWDVSRHADRKSQLVERAILPPAGMPIHLTVRPALKECPRPFDGIGRRCRRQCSSRQIALQSPTGQCICESFFTTLECALLGSAPGQKRSGRLRVRRRPVKSEPPPSGPRRQVTHGTGKARANPAEICYRLPVHEAGRTPLLAVQIAQVGIVVAARTGCAVVRASPPLEHGRMKRAHVCGVGGMEHGPRALAAVMGSEGKERGPPSAPARSPSSGNAQRMPIVASTASQNRPATARSLVPMPTPDNIRSPHGQRGRSGGTAPASFARAEAVPPR